MEETGSPDLVIGLSGLVTTSGALTAGTYVATANATDSLGDMVPVTFSLEVGALVQRTPTTATISTTASPTFSQLLSVGANLGTETFVQTTGYRNFLVSSAGLLTTSGELAAGTYKATGTVSDTTGDVGMFTFTLTVTAPPPPPPAKPTATKVNGDVVGGAR